MDSEATRKIRFTLSYRWGHLRAVLLGQLSYRLKELVTVFLGHCIAEWVLDSYPLRDYQRMI